MNEPLPRFQFWVRRSHGEGAVFSIRFEVEEGKGLLRVARPGVLVDPPARESGFEERLTPAQVRASRFLHVWDGGRKRQGYVLSRLTDAVLNELTRGVWEQMKVISDGGFCWLVPGIPDEPRQATADPETLPGDALEPVDLLEPVTTEAEVIEAPDPDTETVDAVSLLGGADDDSDEVIPALEVEVVQESGPTLPPAGESQAFAPFGRATTLVRHLRREKLRDRQNITQLRADNERLEAELAAAKARTAELEAKLGALNRAALPE